MQIGSGEKHAQKVRLASAFDPTALALSPAEGFLLSRIDGNTTWGELRQMGALAPDEVDRCLSAWLKDGVIEAGAGANDTRSQRDGSGKLASEAAPPRTETAPELETDTEHDREPPKEATRVLGSAAISEVPGLDGSLDIDTEFQQELIDFAAGLDRPYHEILGVAIDADARAMKKAYFQLSKRFHPDRYFRRNTGAFAPVIEVCFKRMLEAYELLSDPATRAEVQREAVAPTAEPAKPVGLGGKKPMSSLEARRRLRQRSGQLSGHRRVINDRKRKAKSFFESGMSSFRNERWLEAAGSVRLAIAFDPDNQAYRESFADVQRRAHEERAKVLLKQANGAYEMRDLKDAYKLFDEAVHYRPFDPELAHRTANLAWSVGNDLKRAKELAQQAVDLEPDEGQYRRTLGAIFAEAGMTANAKREYEAALRIDSKDKEARSALRAL